MTTVNVTKKGQITIPAELRRKYNITPNTKVEVVEEDDKIVIKKLTSIYDLAGAGQGNPEEIKDQLDKARERDARAGSL